MFPGNTDYGEQIAYFQDFNPHIHYHVRMKEKDKHYTAFATPGNSGTSFPQYFDHKPTQEEVREAFSKNERFQEALKN